MEPDSLAEPEAIASTRWLEVLRLDAAGTGGRMGPKTSGGLMVVSLGMVSSRFSLRGSKK